MPNALTTALSFGLLLGLSGISHAASNPDGLAGLDGVGAPAKDTPVKPAEKPRSTRPAYRLSRIDLEQTAGTQTLGVGSDYQSQNPSYDIGLTFWPRYYFIDADDDSETVSARAVFSVTREFTNSDTTTKRGEIAFSDLDLWISYTRELHDRGGYVTEFGLRLPWLTPPTSKLSYDSGKILGVGTMAVLSQTLPILDTPSKLLGSARLSAALGYQYNFTRATVATNPDFERVRMSPDGVSVPSDQLNGASLAEHQGTVWFIGELFLTENLKLRTDLLFKPVWKYPLAETEVCGVVDTGCAQPTRLEDATRHSVVTQFLSQLEYDFGKFGVALGYANVALQLGPDGKRRSPLYSPDARFVLTLTANIDEILAPKGTPNESARAGAVTSPGAN